MMKHRDGNIDLMRLIFMFFICLVHAVAYVESRWMHWLANISYVGVIGFTLISGWCGIRFSIGKVLRFEGMAFICAATVACFGGKCLVVDCGSVFEIYKSYWFVHAYVVMICLTPPIELIFNMLRVGRVHKKNVLSITVPVLVSIYGWSFLSHLWWANRYIPSSSGIESYSGIALFCGYLVGKLVKEFHCGESVRVKWLVCGFVLSSSIVSLPVMCSNFARYDSPLLLLSGLLLFLIIRRIKVSFFVSRVIGFLVPSVLAVYLYHCNPYGYRFMGHVERILLGIGFPIYGVFIANAFLLLICGFILDIPRRIVCLILRNPINRTLDGIEMIYNIGLERLVRRA